MAAIPEFRAALAGDADGEIFDRLDPTLVEAHGRDTVLRVLRGHVARYGILSLGVPELSDDIA